MSLKIALRPSRSRRGVSTASSAWIAAASSITYAARVGEDRRPVPIPALSAARSASG